MSNASARMTFHSFIVGASNRRAVEAARALARGRLGVLVLTGVVGDGKTHLMRAIDAEARRGGAKATYLSSEGFAAALVQALQSQSVAAHCDRLSATDVLLIDDFQFAAGKPFTLDAVGECVRRVVGRGGRVVVGADGFGRSESDFLSPIRRALPPQLVFRAHIAPSSAAMRLRLLRRCLRAHGIRARPSDEQALLRRHGATMRDVEGVAIRVAALRHLKRCRGADAAREYLAFIDRPASTSSQDGRV